MNKARMQRPITRGAVLEFPHVEERTSVEDSIKARLQELTTRVEGFGNPALGRLLTENISVRAAVEELIVKEAALRWIVDVATHSYGPVRGKLWADIDGALTDLERIGESVMRARIIGCSHSDSVSLRDRRDRVVCLVDCDENDDRHPREESFMRKEKGLQPRRVGIMLLYLWGLLNLWWISWFTTRSTTSS